MLHLCYESVILMRLAGSDIEILFVEIEEGRRRFTAEIWLPDSAGAMLICPCGAGEARVRLSAWPLAEQGRGVALIPLAEGAAPGEVSRVLKCAAEHLAQYFCGRNLNIAAGDLTERAAAVAA